MEKRNTRDKWDSNISSRELGLRKNQDYKEQRSYETGTWNSSQTVEKDTQESSEPKEESGGRKINTGGFKNKREVKEKTNKELEVKLNTLEKELFEEDSEPEESKKKEKKVEKYSSSGSDHSENTKKGKINCLCLYQTYDNDMVKCVGCGNFSHGICYGLPIEAKHTCFSCSKPGTMFGNPEITEHYKKKHRERHDKQSFVFKLNKRRVLKSILNQEFLLCQPGKEPTIEFLKIRFGFSSSYASRISLQIVNEGFIKFYGGFSFDGGKIIEALGLHYVDSEVEEEELRREEEMLTNEIGACLSREPCIPRRDPKDGNTKTKEPKRLSRLEEKGKGPNKGKGKRKIESTEEVEGSGKKTRENSPIDELRLSLTSPEMVDISEDECLENERKRERFFSRSETEDSGSERSRTENRKDTEGIRVETKEGEERKLQDKEKEEITSSGGENSGSNELSQTQTMGAKIHRDREGRKYNNKFIWPSRFTQSESLQPGWEPESVALVGKKTTKPIYGQVINKSEPKPNKDDSGKWNFHFVLGMDGSLCQVWVFGNEKDILEIEGKIIEEQYFLFWGEYKIRERYSSKFKCTNDWAIYLDSKCRRFDTVKKSRKYLVSEDSKSEEREIFADRFKPPSKKGKKLRKMKEHNAAKKKLELQTGQRKITEFGKLSGVSKSSEDSSKESSALE